jgi:hypothetical protein
MKTHRFHRFHRFYRFPRTTNLAGPIPSLEDLLALSSGDFDDGDGQQTETDDAPEPTA